MEVNMQKAWKLGLFFGAFVIFGSCMAGDLVGKNAPEITIREWITSNPPDVKSLEDRMYVVEFWATWCPPCRESIPHLISLTNKYRDSGLLFISLSADKSADVVRKFVREKGINYHVAIDNGTSDWFGITGYPTVFVVNHKGKVIWQGQPWERRFEQAINKAINDGPPPLLTGVKLGEFEKFRVALWGGNEFAGAYRQIQKQADNGSRSANREMAQQIISTIDRRIAQRINEADQLREKDLMAAYLIYTDVATKYAGVAAAEPAKKACEKLRKHGLGQQPLLAKKTRQQVE